MRATAPALVALVALAAAAAAGPRDPAAVARDLARGELEPAAAADAWRAAGLDAAAARDLLAAGPHLDGPAEDHTVALTDGVGRRTECDVDLPDAPRADGRYGVLVFLHGFGVTEDLMAPFARRIAPSGTIVLTPSAQRLPVAHENEDSVQRGPAPGAGPLERLARGVHERLFLHWWSYRERSFPLEAVAYALARYPVDPDRVALAGYSMGGYGTWNIGLRYADRFCALAPLAPGISRLEHAARRDERTRRLLDNALMVPSFAVHGDADPIVPVRGSRTVAADLEALGAPHRYVEVPGGTHVLWSFLRGDATTDALARWLAGQERDPHPRRVVHAALGAYHGASAWVRIDALRGEAARIEARVEGDDRVVVATEGVAGLTLYLDPALVAVDGPVTVVVDGEVRHEGVVAPSLEVVAETYALRRDPSLVYARAVRLELPGGEGF